MLENKYDWKISKADKNDSMSVYIYQNDKLIEFHPKNRKEVTSPIFNYLKTMYKNREKFYKYYKIFAVVE
ncbi:TPA: hypothetical protein RTG37_001038 [Campylobacter jejuni]|nr:hypothetical protein [Campylobacter jejuni]HDZ5026409.1 hypothetical protein [Campylobacter jejuni]HDZ5075685.1 hypothetical protein [Campylobacter jejuni]